MAWSTHMCQGRMTKGVGEKKRGRLEAESRNTERWMDGVYTEERGRMGSLTAKETAFVKTLAIALDLLGVVDGSTTGSTLISTSPVWHDCTAKE